MKKNVLILVILSCVFAVDYETEIQPIFNNNCGNCHLGNSSGGLNLSNYDKYISNYHCFEPNKLGIDKIIRIIKERFFNV